MFFASDNTGPVLPEVMQAVNEANTGYVLGYGNDDLTRQVTNQIKEIFEAPDAAVYLVPTGTAANALALSCLAQPYQTIFCVPMAHIQEDECGAPEFYSGAKLSLVGTEDKISPDALNKGIETCIARGFQGVKPGAVSLSQVTEFGQVYTLDEITALSSIAKSHGLPVHMDGARFANAIVSLGCSAAEMTWKAGVDAVSFGGTKNGCMGVEAVVFFDASKAEEFEARRKRGGHLVSKHRYLAAQMQGYLAEDAWLHAARQSNENAVYIVENLKTLGVAFDYEPAANMIFCSFVKPMHEALQSAGASYYFQEKADSTFGARLVCDWSIPRSDIDLFLEVCRAS